MYESFYNLTSKPFSLLPDGDLLFLSKHHKRVVNLLEYGVESQAGFVVISGEVGAGKTTVIRRFLKNVGSNVAVGIITNPSASIGRLLDWITSAFDLKKAPGADDATLYNMFIEFLLAQYAEGKRTVLIIDEAQNLSVTMLEELRMLSNVNNEKDLLLQTVLVGQPELLEMLKRPDLRQFVQRIAVHCHLEPLTPADTAAYIRFRLKHVGAREEIFDDSACAAAYHFTGGIPRLINLLSDQALVYGFCEDQRKIDYTTISEVVLDRGRYGLSPFVNVSDGLVLPKLKADLQKAIDEIGADRNSAKEKA